MFQLLTLNTELQIDPTKKSRLSPFIMVLITFRPGCSLLFKNDLQQRVEYNLHNVKFIGFFALPIAHGHLVHKEVYNR